MSNLHRIYDRGELKLIHRLSIYNRHLIENKAGICGCFSCLAIFKNKQVKKFIEKEGTSLCPKCEVDSIIPETEEFPLTDSLLKQLQGRYFQTISK